MDKTSLFYIQNLVFKYYYGKTAKNVVEWCRKVDKLSVSIVNFLQILIGKILLGKIIIEI